MRSGWAAAVVAAGPPASLTLLHARRIDLSDPDVPESRQPYHAVDEARGELETDEKELGRRLRAIRRTTNESITKFLADCRTNGWRPVRAGVVVGSVIDPSTIHHPHIRAHAMDGRTFRVVLEDALRTHRLSFTVIPEKAAFATASDVLHRREADLRRSLAGLRHDVDGPWRSEEKFATLAAWVAIAGK